MKKIKFFSFVFLVLTITFGGYFYSIVFIKDIRASRAETMGEKYIKNLYAEYSILGKNCQGEDTNNDSYVSCDFRIQVTGASSSDKVIKLQCPTMWKSFTGNTCKESRLDFSANQ